MPPSGVPDERHFNAMYGGRGSHLSPGMAWRLWGAALMLADTYSDDETWGMLKSELPPLALPVADPVWLARFLHSFDAIADRLAAGRSDPVRLTTCTGEELALHIVIDNAEDWSNDGVLSTPESVPKDADRDIDFESARDVLFRDQDVLLLFDASFDGVDDPESELNQRFRFANLHPSRWFLPFADQAGIGLDV